MDLTAMSPREIDTMLAESWEKTYRLSQTSESVEAGVFHAADAKRLYGRGSACWNMTLTEALAAAEQRAENDEWAHHRDYAAKAVASYREHRAALDALIEERKPLTAEYNSRPWTRGYLVTDGHVHSSMDCSTCNNGEYATQFTWLVEFSGKTEAEVIEAAADRACTVCYPNAPVETAGPSLLMTPDERSREEKRQDAAKAKDERTAKRIEKGLTADGSEFVVSYPVETWEWVGGVRQTTGTRDRREHFKTEQAAIQWLVQYTLWDSGRTTEKAPAFAAIRAAIAEKHNLTPEQVEAMLTAKMVAKVRRDEGYSKADAEAVVAGVTR